VPYRELALAAFFEVNVAEAHEAALPFAYAVGRLGCLCDFGEGVHRHCVDVGNFGQAAKLGECLEAGERHERYLPCAAVAVPRFAAHLLEAGVLAYFLAGDVHNHFLAGAVVEVEVVAVN